MATSTTDGDSIVAKYNLLPKLMPHLDRHLIYPLLNFSPEGEEEQSRAQQEILLELLKPTNMTDYVGELAKDLYGLPDMPDEYKQKREQVLRRRDQFEEATSKILELLDDESVVTNLRSDKNQNLTYLREQHGVTVDMVNQLFEFGQFQYSCGLYPHAAELLYRFRILVCRSALPAAKLDANTLHRQLTTTRNARPPGASSPARFFQSTGRPPWPRSRRLRNTSTAV